MVVLKTKMNEFSIVWPDYGRAKIGLLVPATNSVMEDEFHALAPEDVVIATARMLHRGRKPGDTFAEMLRKMSTDIPNAALKISRIFPDVVAFGCTSGSFLEGEDWNKKITKDLSEIVSPAKVVTTSTAVKNALRKLKLKKIAVVTPYPDDINNRLKSYLESQEFNVVRLDTSHGLGPATFIRSNKMAYHLAKRIDGSDIDGIFISCTDFRTIEILDALERDVGKPIVSSNQATMWDCLRAAKIGDKIEGCGILLRRGS